MGGIGRAAVRRPAVGDRPGRESILHNWPFLTLGVVSAAALKVYVGTERIASLFQRRTGYAVAGSVGAAVVDPVLLLRHDGGRAVDDGDDRSVGADRGLHGRLAADLAGAS